MATDTMTDAEFLREQMKEEERLAVLQASGITPESGRMWIGKNISQPQFDRLPQGARITSTAPVFPPEALAAERARWVAPPAKTDPQLLAEYQANDRPGSRTISVNSEAPGSEASLAAMVAQQKYEAMKQYQFLTGNGMPAPQALAQSGMNMFLPQNTQPKPPTWYQEQQVRLADERNRISGLRVNQPPTKRIPPEVQGELDRMMQAFHDAAYGGMKGGIMVLKDPAKAQKMKDAIIEYRKRYGIETPMEEKSQAGPVSIPTPSPKLVVPQAGSVMKGYKFLGGDPSNKSNWEKVK